MMKCTISTRLTFFGAVCLILIFLSAPCSASFVFQRISVSPSSTVQPGRQLSCNSQLVIIPQGGPTTFIENNQLELTTQLEAAQWNVDVLVNGIPAAQMPVKGNTVFINGFLLSYPVSDDVAVSPKVSGIVPSSAGPDLNVVQAVQLNNAGQVVPGSTQTITEPVAAPGTMSVPATPVQSPEARQTTPVPTKSAGCSVPAVTGAVVICALLVKFETARKAEDIRHT